MAAPYEWQVSLAKLLRTFERNRLEAEAAVARSTKGEWTALADTELQDAVRTALPKGQTLAQLDPSQMPTLQLSLYPSLAKARTFQYSLLCLMQYYYSSRRRTSCSAL